jgi:BCCT family betaine/carnitine transporter
MKKRFERLDWVLMFIPAAIVIVLCMVFMVLPERAGSIIEMLRVFLGDTFGFYYMLLGLGILVLTLGIAFSGYGKIRLGNTDKPVYNNFQWGAMIFTSTMAADIVYYSFIEWALYGGEEQIEKMGGLQKWAPTYPLFHWGPIPWGFYVILAIAFGFMIHVRGRNRQKFSEACRPLLGDRVDGAPGKVIDLFAVFTLLAGTATTFSLATPLMSAAVSQLSGFPNSPGLTIGILLVIAALYTTAVWFSFKGISFMASLCVWLFFGLALWVFLGGGEGIYIIETGISSIGNLVQNFVGLSTWMDPMRETGFVQNWTIYYWAYWLVWCVATPFFIGVISKGRTIKNMILGVYISGLLGTFMSFLVFGNYGLSQQMRGTLDVIGMLESGVSIPDAILSVFRTLPASALAIFLLIVTMLAFYSTTFDSLTMVVSMYSYKQLEAGEKPERGVCAFWSVVFVIFPIGLIFAGNSLRNLQSISIIAAFPISVILLLIVVSFFKDANRYLRGKGETDKNS